MTHTDDDMIESLTERFRVACPTALRELPCWLLWKAVATPDGRVLKKPHYANGRTRGAHGTPDDIASLATFEQVLRGLEGGGYTGIGFATLPQFGLVVADFDDKRGEGLHPDADRVAETSYSERSYSGAGIHVIWRGECESRKNNNIGVELFSDSGFLVFTGKRLNASEVEPLRDNVKAHLLKLVSGSPIAPTLEQDQTTGVIVQPETVAALRSALRVLDADSYDSWIRQGQRLKTLGAIGRGLWLDWSATSSKFDQTEASQKWDGFTANRTGYAAVFTEAQASGWLNPSSRLARDFEPMETLPDAINDKAKDKTPKPYFISVGELLNDRSPTAWLIQGLIELGAIALLVGPPSAGKSFLLLCWCLNVVLGRQWYGNRSVRQGTVIYIAGEGHSGFRRRCAAWAKHHGVDISDAPLFFNQQTVQLIDEQSCLEAHQAVAAVVKQHGPIAMLCLDTFNRTAGSDENSNTDTAKVLHHVEKYFQRPFNCAVLVVHHSGHEAQRARGASALPAAADSVFQLADKGGVRVLSVTKSKESALPPDMSFKLESVSLDDWEPDPDTGELPSSAVIVPSDEAMSVPKRKKLTPRLTDAIDALYVATQEHGEDAPEAVTKARGLLAPSRCVAETFWREGFYGSPSLAADLTPDAKQKAFRRAVDDLLDRELINGSHGFYWRIG